MGGAAAAAHQPGGVHPGPGEQGVHQRGDRAVHGGAVERRLPGGHRAPQDRPGAVRRRQYAPAAAPARPTTAGGAAPADVGVAVPCPRRRAAVEQERRWGAQCGVYCEASGHPAAPPRAAHSARPDALCGAHRDVHAGVLILRYHLHRIARARARTGALPAVVDAMVHGRTVQPGRDRCVRLQ
eukprot:scaffold5846_cov333-Prasinococcus_capsulatus_cf.AAC.7